ncbi:MAG: hypothetical protein AB1938_25950 [Myxococcota bacterium]
MASSGAGMTSTTISPGGAWVVRGADAGTPEAPSAGTSSPAAPGAADTTRATTAAASAGALPTPQRQREVVSESPPSPPVRITRWEVLAGAGVWTPTPSSASLALSLDGALVLQERWRLGLTSSFSFGDAVPVTDDSGASRGTLTARALLIAPEASVCTTTRLRGCGGLLAGVRLGVGSTAGEFIFQAKTKWVATPSFGPVAHLSTSFSRVAASLDLALLINPVPSGFSLEGLSARIDTPTVEFVARLSFGYGVDR